MKSISSTLGLIILAVSLTACSKGKSPESKLEATATKETKQQEKPVIFKGDKNAKRAPLDAITRAQTSLDQDLAEEAEEGSNKDAALEKAKLDHDLKMKETEIAAIERKAHHERLDRILDENKTDSQNTQIMNLAFVMMLLNKQKEMLEAANGTTASADEETKSDEQSEEESSLPETSDVSIETAEQGMDNHEAPIPIDPELDAMLNTVKKHQNHKEFR